jgi:hypothetical protein
MGRQSARRPPQQVRHAACSSIIPPAPPQGVLLCILRLSLTSYQGQAPLFFKGSLRLFAALRMSSLRRSAHGLRVLFGVRSPRPFTSLSAPPGSASRELCFAQYPALRRPSPRFFRASCELTALAHPQLQTSSASLRTACFRFGYPCALSVMPSVPLDTQLEVWPHCDSEVGRSLRFGVSYKSLLIQHVWPSCPAQAIFQHSQCPPDSLTALNITGIM